MSGVNFMSNNVGAAGRARQKQLAAQAEAERRELEAGLLRDLGRPAATVDIIAIETLAAAIVRARALRRQGKSDAEATRMVAQLLRATGLKPSPATPPAPLTLQQQLAARGYATPPTRTEADKAEEPAQ
jgi:hypothetical protein